VRILLIVHGLPPACAGGTETYTLDLAHALAAQPGVAVGILSREADAARPELGIRYERRRDLDVWFVNNTFQSCHGFEDTYTHRALCDAVLPSVEAFAPDVVHVQHLTALSTLLPEALTARGIPVVMTLNDYWPICHRGQLLNVRGERCGGPGADGCAECIPIEVRAPAAVWRASRRSIALSPLTRITSTALRRVGPTTSTKALSASRAHHMRQMLSHASILLAPSETLRDRYRAFGIEDARLLRCEQGIRQTAAPRTGVSRNAGKPLRVLFAGSLMYSKAPALILDAIALLPDELVKADFIGTVSPYHGEHSYSSALLTRLGGAHVQRYGPAPHERVADAIGRADVVVVPSIWIENAPFVIKEAFACGVPVVASGLGGMAELVRDGVNGLLFEPGDARSLADALRRLIEEPELLPALRRGIQPPLTIEKEAEGLEALYRTTAAARGRTVARRGSVDRGARGKLSVAAVVLNYGTPDETFVAARSIQTSRYPADAIVVDNGSRDEERLRALLPDVEVVGTGRNLGFSGGCNAGIAHGLARGADAILLLNSDAILQPDALGLLVEALSVHPSAGAAAPVLCAAAEPSLVSSAGITYDMSTGRMRHRGFGQRRGNLGTEAVASVDAASGCALLVRREVFARCGVLDEDYFFSFEDVEFCLRARAAGFATVVVSAATVLHKGGTTIGSTSARRMYYGVRNHLRLAQQVAPRRMLPRIARTAAILTYNAAYVMRSPDVPLFDGAAALTRGSLDHFRRRYGA
jgi:GT2 family glycosyltransferase/glycosyltransferase involved in cell wall biosynthesis